MLLVCEIICYISFQSQGDFQIAQSKRLPHRKVKLVDENLLEGIQIVLLVEDKHCLLVVDGVNRTETQRTVAVGYQNGIAGNAGRALVAVRIGPFS